MLGGSLAAQPEHETISVNRMRSPPFLSGIESIWFIPLPIGDWRLPIGINRANFDNVEIG